MSGYDFSKWLNNEFIPNNPEHVWIKEVSSKAVKQSIMNAEKAFKRFFNGLSKFPNLYPFNAQHHNRTREKFIDLDIECIKINRYRLSQILFKTRPKQFWMRMNQDVKSSEYSILLRELEKSRNVKPLRTIIPACRNFIMKIKPCFMMSPLSVAKYLPADEGFIGFFDLSLVNINKLSYLAKQSVFLLSDLVRDNSNIK